MVAVLKSSAVVFVLCLVAVSSAFGSATNIYITQNGSPSGNCTANVQTPAFFNSASNWGSAAGQIGPGTTVLICGTFTGSAGATEFTFQKSGNSSSPVTLKFDSGAVLSAPYWSANGAISCTNLSYITVDGGSTGVIQNTANGTNQSNHQSSAGFAANGCTNSQVMNLTIKNIYINAGSSSNASDTNGVNTQDIVFNGNSTGSIVANNTLSQAKTGVMFCADPGGDASGVQIYGNNISDMDWGINVGGGDNGDTMNGLLVHDNTITNWTNWQFPTDAMHQDGMIFFNFATGSQTLTASVYSNYIYGDLGVGSPTGFIYCAQNASCNMFNNLLVNTGHVIYGIIWADTHRGGDTIYNNTIIGLSNDFAVTLGTSTGTNVNTPDIVENNIVVGPAVGIHDYSNLASDVSTSDHNVWRTASGSAPQMATNDSTYVSYSTWQGEGFDAHSTNANPNLDSTYHLQSGSPALGLAANLVNLNDALLDLDMSNQPRPGSPGSPQPAGTAWDAGIYNGGNAPPPAPTNLSASVK